MIPRTYPSTVNTSTGKTQMVVYFLSSITGLTRWIDYIPVQWGTAGTPRENSTDTGGYLSVDSLSSTTGKQAWVDYIPVYLDASATGAWTIDSVGFLPIGISGVGGMPMGLFASSEQGAWYDPSDMSTMYQDSAGTTPVTAVGQPVGLILDKRLGAVRGTDVAPDGGAFIDANWSKGAGWSIAGGVATHTGASTVLTSNTSPLTIGKWYEITVQVGGASSSFNFVIGTNFVNSAGNIGTCRVIGQCLGSGVIQFQSGGSGQTFSSLSVKELPGNHATQATAPSRPTLSARYNLLTKTQDFSDGGSWAKINGATFVNQTSGPDGTLSAGTVNIAAGGVGTPSGIRAALGGLATTTGTKVRVLAKRSSVGSANAVRLTTNDQVAWNTGGSSKLTLTNEWQEVSINAALQGTATGTARYVYIGAADVAGNNDADCVGNVDLAFPDVRLSADASLNIPSYQRVNTATDYDTTGFPLYLSFDGVDDSLATGSVDFSATDKMTVFAGVHKAAEAVGMVTELSTSTGSNNNTFDLYTNTGSRWAANLTGTTEMQGNSPANFTAPVSSVVALQFNMAGGTAAQQLGMRVNGAAQTVTFTLSTGTVGNFANQPLYIGRRGGSTLPFNGRLYSLIVRGAATDAASLSATERYVGSKMGVTW